MRTGWARSGTEWCVRSSRRWPIQRIGHVAPPWVIYGIADTQGLHRDIAIRRGDACAGGEADRAVDIHGQRGSHERAVWWYVTTVVTGLPLVGI